ncbi:MAG: beta-lactamase family protein [Bacteroidales bacterium]|nr:beta-lactamase family protein [Bacteroidales bacterium]
MLKNIHTRFKILARNISVLLACFFFTTFVTEKNSAYTPLILYEKITENIPVDYVGRSLENLIRYYDDYMEASVSDDITPGAAIAVTYKGDIRLLKCYGVKKKGTSDSINIHTAFRLGSVSKGFASVLTGIMTRDNIIGWDDNIAPYLPDFHHRDSSKFNALTVKHILSHTSGFPVHTFTDLLDDNVPYGRILEQLETVPFSTRPGRAYSYQNVVFSFIDEILKNTSGKDYAYLLRDKLFFPLQMQDASSEYVSLIMSGNYACPHLRTRNAWTPLDNNTRYYATIPASGINASISDMAQWLLALTGSAPEVVPPDVLEEVFQPVVEIPMRRSYRRSWGNADELSYAMGWRTIRVDNRKIVFHSGYVQGFRAEIGFCPDDKVGIVLLFNGNSQDVNNMLPEFFDNLYHNYPWEPFYAQLQKI